MRVTEQAEDIARRVKEIPSKHWADGALFRHYGAVLDDPTPADVRFFRSLLRRTEKTFVRRNIRKIGKDEGRRVIDVPSSPQTALKVVCVSSQLDIWSQTRLKLTSLRDGRRALRATPAFCRRDWDIWKDDRLSELKAALKFKPNIICFPEFSYPPPHYPEAEGLKLSDEKAAAGRRGEFEKSALALVGKSEIFLCLGSYHCPMSLYNISVIYPWGPHQWMRAQHVKNDTSTTEFGGIEKEPLIVRNDFEAPAIYRKRFPAQKLGEQVRTPAGRKVDVFHSGVGNILVLICSDVLDLNQFLMIVHENQNQPDYDCILIPSYNPSPMFSDLCRDLSAFAATTVIVANARDSSRRDFPPSEIYVCGDNTEELNSSSFDERHGVLLKKQSKPVGASELTYFELNKERLKNARDVHRTRMQVGEAPTGKPK